MTSSRNIRRNSVLCASGVGMHFSLFGAIVLNVIETIIVGINLFSSLSLKETHRAGRMVELAQG